MIEALANRPVPPGAKALRERPGLYRIRLDRWRLIYRVDDEVVLVLILRVRRKLGPETYEDLE